MNSNIPSTRRKTYYQLHRNANIGYYKEKHLGYTITVDDNVYFIDGRKVTHGKTGLLVGNIDEFNELISDNFGRNRILEAIAEIEQSIKAGKIPTLEEAPLFKEKKR